MTALTTIPKWAYAISDGPGTLIEHGTITHPRELMTVVYKVDHNGYTLIMEPIR